ncbi:MAG TPA: ParB/RepB/Spo0J family partition protein [Bacteroidota bacterium]|nr:ParB/RepB/Spo0J family partition protein [Candidatus Kapabacteria bacterium]HRS01732.1 ParB/RepB/Spo0J family partition protein [Bacteroidota bacterium]HRT68456.1 ParB/RepB/Spo0J family partition protein [Bacteroidota bacterium]
MKTKTGLGKGLDALLPHSEIVSQASVQHLRDNAKFFDFIEISKILINPYQPRQNFDLQAIEELSQSIKKHGLLQPITVRRVVDGFELITGERRLRACKHAGLDKIPAYILEIDEDVKLLEMAIIENVQRVDLNPIELASGYQRLIEECSYTQEQVAERVGKERSTVTNFIRLLKLPEKVQDDLRDGFLSMGHARALLSLNEKDLILAADEEIKSNQLSVRQTERLVKDILDGKIVLINGKLQSTKSIQQNDFQEEIRVFLQDKEDELRQKYATKVKIKAKDADSGSIEFEFYSKDEFDRLLDIFTKLK